MANSRIELINLGIERIGELQNLTNPIINSHYPQFVKFANFVYNYCVAHGAWRGREGVREGVSEGGTERGREVERIRG